jgi:hypothetical protein
MELLFNAIGIALVGLSAVVLAAILYVSLGGLSGLDSINPAVFGTVLFSVLVGVAAWLTKRVTDRSTARTV